MGEITVVDIPQLPEKNETGDSPREAHTECISCISDDLRKQKWEAYVPKVVSLGPIHYGEPQVAKGEKNKQRCKQYLSPSEDLPQVAKGEKNKQRCKQYLSPSEDLPSFSKLVEDISKLVEDISSDQWSEDISSDQWSIQQWYYRQFRGYPQEVGLGAMMALDGLFLLQFLGDITGRSIPAYFRGHPDPFERKSYIEEDIMKLENQIPLLVVKKVCLWDGNTDDYFNEIISEACNYLCPFQKMNFSDGPPPATSDSHLLGFMYENIVRCSQEEKAEDSQKKKSSCTLRQAVDRYSKRVEFMYNIIRYSKEEKVEDSQKKKSISTLVQSADIYSKKGVKFRAAERSVLNKICFNDKTRTFYLPAIKMDSKTDAVMRNLLAYEALDHTNSAKPLLCYIDLMERLINEPEDVKVLKDGGIIEMHLSENREVADVWNAMRKVLVQYGKSGEYIPIHTAVDGVTTFCDRKYRIWCLEFKKKYFSRPWLPAALIGGCFSLLLSLLQTILAWKQYRLQLKGM